MARRAAVLIGVGKCTGLPELHAVYDGVQKMEAWAQESLLDEIHVVTDINEAVTAQAIRKIVKDIVDQSNFDQLFIYFAGHGVNLHYSEYWLLTDAMEDTQASINLAISVQLAKGCGIPHVVIFSDACRTAPETVRMQGIRGSEIFPNRVYTGPRKAIDVFYASLLGEPALEIPDKQIAANAYQSVFTNEIVASLLGQRRTILKSDPANLGTTFLRSWPLKEHLMLEVPRIIAHQLGLASPYTQVPDAEVLSNERAYIAAFQNISPEKSGENRPRARGSKPIGRLQTEVGSIERPLFEQGLLASTGNVASTIKKALIREPNAAVSRALDRTLTTLPFENTFGRTQILVRGMEVVSAWASQDVAIELPSGSEIVVDDENWPAINVLIKLSNATCIVIPAIKDFTATLTFEGAELLDVAYDPSSGTKRFRTYVRQREELLTIRSVVAASAYKGAFRLTQESLAKLPEKMRLLKGVDPTMAIYATHMYNRLDEITAIDSIQTYLIDDLGFTIYDVAMFSTNPAVKSIFPFFPMLGQGWPLLSSSEELIEILRPHVLIRFGRYSMSKQSRFSLKI